MSRWICGVVTACAAWFSTVPATAQTASQAVPVASPSSIPHDVATPVLITALIPPSPNLLRDSVQLLQYGPDGRVLFRHGTMYDDGTRGDERANDSVFSIVITLRQAGPADVVLRASVAYRGQLLRVLSQPLSVTVTIEQHLDAMRELLASALLLGRRSDAYAVMGDRLAGRRVLDGLGAADLAAIGAGVTGCAIIQATEKYSLCTAPLVLSSGPATLNFVFVKDAYGVWRLLGW
jgi:hypothetical protein